MKMMSLLTVGLLALALATPADAAHHGCKKGHEGRGKPTFAQVDANDDGGISEQELMEFRGKRMADKAKEGKQLKNAANAPAFADIDTDGDGAISEDEFAAHQGARKCNCGEQRRKKHGDEKQRGECKKNKEVEEA